jgi:hypothetical protein
MSKGDLEKKKLYLKKDELIESKKKLESKLLLLGEKL